MDAPWRTLADAQSGMIARRQLLRIGVGRNRIRNHITAGRWAARSSTVISTFTGPLGASHRRWLGVLHAGGASLVGGLSAAAVHGLLRWDREDVSVLVDDQLVLEPISGIRWVRTRRALDALRDPRSDLPLCQLEPAVLLTAAYGVSKRAGQGLLASVVQQRLTTAGQLLSWSDRLRPLHRAPLFREVLAEISGGAQSIGEIDVGRLCRDHGLAPPTRQVRRTDSAGRGRFTDCEWRRADGYTVVLEVDGGFHMEAEHWEDDIARQRRLSEPGRILIRCTTRELRDDPGTIAADLVRLGVPRIG